MTKFLSIELHETMARPGTEEDSLTEILMSRTNQELSEIDTFFSACKYNLM
jgi:annexin A7/11